MEELKGIADDIEIPKEDDAFGLLPTKYSSRSLKSSLEMNTFLFQNQKLVPLLVSINPRIQKAYEYFIIFPGT